MYYVPLTNTDTCSTDNQKNNVILVSCKKCTNFIFSLAYNLYKRLTWSAYSILKLKLNAKCSNNRSIVIVYSCMV